MTELVPRKWDAKAGRRLKLDTVGSIVLCLF